MLEGGLEVTLRSCDNGEPNLDHLGGGPGAGGQLGQRNDFVSFGGQNRGLCGWDVGGQGEHGLSCGQRSAAITVGFASQGWSHRAERRPGGHWAGGFQDVSQVFKRSPVWSLHCGCAHLEPGARSERDDRGSDEADEPG